MTARVASRPRTAALGLLGAAALLAVALHVRAGTTFPVSWPDEIDFLTPAANLARHGSLRVPELNAPHGMFWVPDLYYLVLAPLFRVLPLTISVGRAVSLVAMLVAAGGFWVAATRAGARPVFSAAVVGAWLLSPSAVLAGNIARQEALVLAFVAWSLAATVSGRRPLALSLAALAALTHPAGVAYALIAVAANARHRAAAPSRRMRRAEWVLVGGVIAVAAFQLGHLLAHLDVALDQLRFQLHRKADRDPRVPKSVMLLGYGLVIAAVWRWRHDRRAPLLGTLVALSTVCVVGQEMWYSIYGWPTALMLGALIASASVPWTALSAFSRTALAPLAVVGMAALVALAWASPFYGMRFGHEPDEWSTFVKDVHAQLVQLSESSPQETVVVINDLSGLPWPLTGDHVGRVRLVKETSTTRVTSHRPPLELYARTICCNPYEAVPPGDIVSQVTSPHGTFDATLLRRG